ncbi:unnamed protein product [Effrenium voratum]|nr:unnamed protein product [Effrenium voratum]
MALQDECKIQGYLTVKSTLNTMKAHGYGIKPGSVERKGGGMDIGTLTFEAEKLDQRLYGIVPSIWSEPSTGLVVAAALSALMVLGVATVLVIARWQSRQRIIASVAIEQGAEQMLSETDEA